jgi:serpin B
MEEADARPSKKARRPGAGSGGLTLFALRLAKQLSEGDSSGDNLLFSPLSIYAALALVAAGAGGETLDGAASCDELAEFVRGVAEGALADRSGSAGGQLVAVACGVWHQETLALRPAYRAAAVESYKAEARHRFPREGQLINTQAIPQLCKIYRSTILKISAAACLCYYSWSHVM